MPHQGSRRAAGVLRLPCRALGSSAHEQPPSRACSRPCGTGRCERRARSRRPLPGRWCSSWSWPHQRPGDGSKHKSVAEAHRRCQIQRWHRGHPNAGKPRRLITSSPKIPHSSRRRPAHGKVQQQAMNTWDEIPKRVNLLPLCAQAGKLDLAPRSTDLIEASGHVPRAKADI